VIFLVCCGPGYVVEIFHSLQIFVNAYISPPPTGLIAWPNVLGVVNEAKAQGILVTLKTLHPFLPLVAVGFVGLAYLCIRHFRQMGPLAPLLARGAWSLIGPNRFSMYLAPMVAVGIGVVIQLIVELLWRRSRLPQALASPATLFLLFATFLSATAYSGLPKPPLPALAAATTRTILDLKERLPQHSAMFTPFWEYGYALMEIGDFATYHDGGLQGGMRTTLTSIASMSSEQGEMVSLLAYLEDQGFNQLSAKIQREKLTPEQMLKLVFDYPQPFSGENVYVLYLEPMIWKTLALARFGNWDFNRRQSQPSDYFDLPCFSMENNVMRCSDGTVDLSRGVMNDGRIDIPLKSALFVNDGYVVKQTDYPHDGEYYLQVLMHKGKIFRVLVVGRQLFLSNFNQQYLLGNYDRNSFEEVYNDFPIARVLKVKKGAVGHPPEQR
jgi:dolichyl-diphosphooligosaccharide--protein glycosyltransferase